MMQCDRCNHEAVMHAAYSGGHLCETHFCDSVERRVRHRIRKDSMLAADATPEDPDTWVIGLSGGKDSVVLTHILGDVFGVDSRVELVALSIHEGIEGYRDDSLDASKALIAQLDADLDHETVSYAEELGVEMDEVVRKDPHEMTPCAYCGVFRRDLLETHAERLGADKLFTGHNLDDEAETAMMNYLEGDIQQIAKHYDASLGDFDQRSLTADFVPRAKPLRDVPEKEVALYAHIRDLPAHIAECPHASESFRGTIQELLLDLEVDHPGTRHSIMAGYEELAELAAMRYRGEDSIELSPCEDCGSMTGGDICRKCQLVAAVQAV